MILKLNEKKCENRKLDISCGTIKKCIEEVLRFYVYNNRILISAKFLFKHTLKNYNNIEFGY